MGQADRLAVAAAALEPDDLDVRVAAEETDQLGPDVPRRTDDPDPNAGAGARSAVRLDRGRRLEARAHRHAGPLAGSRLEDWIGIGGTAVMTA
jgi:hypothetical protein